MRYYFPFFFCFLLNLLSAQQNTPIRIVYENKDAYNPLKQTPYLAPYINRIEQAEPIKGKERSTLRLYQDAGIYTIDSVYLYSLGNKAKFLRYSIINIKSYTLQQRFSIYHNLPTGFAYFEKNESTVRWEIDKKKTKNILGLNCYFASTKVGKDFHQIWFTNDLPYQDGPFPAVKEYNYNLPGLVLEHIMGDGYTTTAVDITIATYFLNLKDKIEQLQAWKKTPKPSFPPENPDSDGLVLLNKESPTQVWVPLLYKAEGHKGWLQN